MADDSTRTVLVALGAGLGVALAKVGAAVFTGSSAMAAEATHSLSDTANDLFLFGSRLPGRRRAGGAGQFLQQEHEGLVGVAGGLTQAHLAGAVGRQVRLRRRPG